MSKNRFTLIAAVLFVVLVSIAISSPVIIPVTGANNASDYYQRHPELRLSEETRIDMTDYFMRHPKLRAPAKANDLTDYFFRH